MGGIIAADAFLSILDDDPVTGKESKLPFPHIAGILAFDTPYLGLAPSVFAHSAGEKWKTASSTYSTLSSIASGLFASQAAVEGTVAKTKEQEERERNEKAKNELSQQSLWGSWGKVAAYSGAAAALAGGAAAAYLKRDDISAGFGWVSSHLEFVGALMKAEELKDRVGRASTVDGVGFANLFTSLGGDRMGSSMLFEGNERTFCSLPADESPLRRKFFRCVNVKADDEVGAHCSMFEPTTNPAYYELADRARGLVCLWVKEDSYIPIEEEEEDMYGSFRMQPRSSTLYERESKSPKSGSRRSSHDQILASEPCRSSRDQGKLSSSRRSSHDVGSARSSPRPDLERTGSSRSSKSGHDKEKKEKKERSGSIYDEREERLRSERTGSIYGRELERSGSSRSSLSGKDKEKGEKEKSSRRKSSTTQYQMNYDENPWH